MTELRTATAADTADITAIWQDAFFEDTPQDIAMFLQAVTPEKDCLLLCVDGQPVSMGFFLPATLRCEGRVLPLRYLYAAATRSELRGRRLFAELLTGAHAYWEQRGAAAVFLKPATPSLMAYYQRFGYRSVFFCRTVNGAARRGKTPLWKMPAQAYPALRAAALPTCAVEWDARLVTWAADTAEVVAIGENACALCRKQGDCLQIVELLGVEPSRQEALCGELAAFYECTAFSARLYAANGDCFGMLYPLQPETEIPPSPYMGLAFD